MAIVQHAEVSLLTSDYLDSDLVDSVNANDFDVVEQFQQFQKNLSILAILTTPAILISPIRLLTFITTIVSIQSSKLAIYDEHGAVTDFHTQSCASGQQ